MKLASNVVVIEIAGQRPIMTIATKGIRAFTNEIGRRRPDLPIELGWQARFAERMPGWSRFKNVEIDASPVPVRLQQPT